jgi:four helix bundle protein
VALDVHAAARELIEALHVPLATLAERDGDLARQLRRAAPSVLFNIGEGSRRAGKDRLHHYRIAAGSAGEVQDALFVARAWHYVDDALLARSEALTDRILAMLWKLTH